MLSDRPVAVLDSGLGGLTVLRALRELLPDENLIYFGDTARVPYGTKSPATIIRFALQDCSYLMRFSPKLLVVACNTVSAVALPELREELHIEVIGVIRPGAEEAVRSTARFRIGVIATEATVHSGVYEREIKTLEPRAVVIMKACPLLVPIIEEGRSDDDPITRLLVEEYVAPLKAEEIDCLVLACTHYPLIRRAIEETAGEGVNVVDSAYSTARAVRSFLAERALLRTSDSSRYSVFFATDSPARFAELGTRFLGSPLDTVYMAYPEDAKGIANISTV